MRSELVRFREFLQQHTEDEVRQGVLHRTNLGIEFLTLQRQALQRNEYVRTPEIRNYGQPIESGRG